MSHLRSVSLGRQPTDEFPFSVPTIRTLGELAFETPVPFFVGENGSGKSTLLAGIALSAGLPTVGGGSPHDDETLNAQKELGKAVKRSWSKRTRRGFCLRAEDFFGCTNQLSKLRGERKAELARGDAEYEGR